MNNSDLTNELEKAKAEFKTELEKAKAEFKTELEEAIKMVIALEKAKEIFLRE